MRPAFQQSKVSTHSHPKVAACKAFMMRLLMRCFNTQPPEGGCESPLRTGCIQQVSTHSHPKVAAVVAIFVYLVSVFQHTATRRWLHPDFFRQGGRCRSFNTQPPEGGCNRFTFAQLVFIGVSTHSRTKAAAHYYDNGSFSLQGFNTQPHEGGCFQSNPF